MGNCVSLTHKSHKAALFEFLSFTFGCVSVEAAAASPQMTFRPICSVQFANQLQPQVENKENYLEG